MGGLPPKAEPIGYRELLEFGKMPDVFVARLDEAAWPCTGFA
jgi:hypothetical protein